MMSFKLFPLFFSSQLTFTWGGKAITCANASVPHSSEKLVGFLYSCNSSRFLNLQKANRVIYFTPPLSSELFEQSKKRIHRIGQNKTCFYYYLVCRGSIEEKIYRTLAKRKDYTDKLFEQEENNG